MIEYARNKIVVSLHPTDLLMIENWKPVKVIFRMMPNNHSKCYLAPFPNFDMKDFPFLVCSGSESYSLINVRDYKMQNLINASCANVRGQQAFFFKKEEFGYSLHFTTKEITFDGQEI